MKISLLGQFGSGNSGNDGSLEAMLLCLRRYRPDAQLLCICSNPTFIEARYHIRSISVGGPKLSSGWSKAANRLLLKLPRRLALVVTAIGHLHGFDVMIIPGTGILDDFQEKAFGWPFVIFSWCLLARFCRTKIVFVSIGAGPINGRLSRWFLRSAAKMASYRSYRDDTSLEFMRELGIDVSNDRRFPDIAFALAEPAPGVSSPVSGTLSVGVGVMYYKGWRANNPRGGTIYETYVEKISTFVSRLLRDGYRVSLLTGDRSDQRACDDVMSRLSEMVAKTDLDRIETAPGTSLHDIMRQISKVDLAVVSRYHNLVCSLKLNRPTISLGYARKNDDLMGDFGQAPYCRGIETFDVDELTAMFAEILRDRESIKSHISSVNERLQYQLIEQQHLLAQLVFSDPSSLSDQHANTSENVA